jgi:hypothetical protein
MQVAELVHTTMTIGNCNMKILLIAVKESGDEDEVLGVEVTMCNGTDVRTEFGFFLQDETTNGDVY